MSPRRNHPKRSGRASSSRGKKDDRDERDISTSSETVEEHSDGIYMVRKITGSRSEKPYRCPGCDQIIPTATPHIVAWLEEDIDSRRHWHTPCWSKRNERKPRIERSRNAPRY